ncbi:hypothetical protein [uncultured Parabacteroides sp.]|uniref:hypothetical protein n=1 Tax=uncultured Parabacteroides sp. TaxID=512312 RepID=UPI0026066FF3|nr:hypothetical protein [uncultured Parabacteroides sp.]
MINAIKTRFALSEKGAKDFCKGVFFTVLLDIALMLLAFFVFIFLDDWLRTEDEPLFYSSRTQYLSNL